MGPERRVERARVCCCRGERRVGVGERLPADDASVPQDCELVGEAQELVQEVRDVHDSAATITKLANRVEQRNAFRLSK